MTSNVGRDEDVSLGESLSCLLGILRRICTMYTIHGQHTIFSYDVTVLLFSEHMPYKNRSRAVHRNSLTQERTSKNFR